MSRRVSLPGADELFRNTATLSAVLHSEKIVKRSHKHLLLLAR